LLRQTAQSRFLRPDLPYSAVQPVWLQVDDHSDDQFPIVFASASLHGPDDGVLRTNASETLIVRKRDATALLACPAALSSKGGWQVRCANLEGHQR